MQTIFHAAIARLVKSQACFIIQKKHKKCHGTPLPSRGIIIQKRSEIKGLQQMEPERKHFTYCLLRAHIISEENYGNLITFSFKSRTFKMYWKRKMSLSYCGKQQFTSTFPIKEVRSVHFHLPNVQ